MHNQLRNPFNEVTTWMHGKNQMKQVQFVHGVDEAKKRFIVGKTISAEIGVLCRYDKNCFKVVLTGESRCEIAGCVGLIFFVRPKLNELI